MMIDAQAGETVCKQSRAEPIYKVLAVRHAEDSSSTRNQLSYSLQSVSHSKAKKKLSAVEYSCHIKAEYSPQLSYGTPR